MPVNKSLSQKTDILAAFFQFLSLYNEILQTINFKIKTKEKNSMNTKFKMYKKEETHYEHKI